MIETTTQIAPAMSSSIGIADSGTDAETSQTKPCVTIKFESNNVRHRYRFEPRADGNSWWRYKDEWTGTEWELRNRKPARAVSLSIDGNAVLSQ